MRKIIYITMSLFFVCVSSCSTHSNPNPELNPISIPSKGSFTDSRDGQTYSTVKIGDQVWLAQNLNYVTENGSWPVPGDPTGTQLGRFYTWEAAKEAVPAGWHLPSNNEFEKLAATLGVTDLPNWNDLYPLLIEGGISGFNVQLIGSHNQSYQIRGRGSFFLEFRRGVDDQINPFLSKSPGGYLSEHRTT